MTSENQILAEAAEEFFTKVPLHLSEVKSLIAASYHDNRRAINILIQKSFNKLDEDRIQAALILGMLNSTSPLEITTIFLASRTKFGESVGPNSYASEIAELDQVLSAAYDYSGDDSTSRLSYQTLTRDLGGDPFSGLKN